MCETKLDSDIKNVEFLNSNSTYKVYRKDRNRRGGGVLIAIKDCYTVTEIHQPDSNCEIIWSEVQLSNQRKAFIGSFYRPPSSNMDTIEALENSINQLKRKSNNNIIMLGGDFNVGDINWDTLSVHPGANQIKVQQGILDILAENHLDQIQHEPSREDRILDLFITSHPGLIKNCCVIPGISDHDAVITDSNIKPVINKKPAHFFPLYSKANWEQIKKNTINFATDYS